MSSETEVLDPNEADAGEGGSHSVNMGSADGGEQKKEVDPGDSEALVITSVVKASTDKEKAQNLDAEIDLAIVQFSKTLAIAYVDLGLKLQSMREMQGYKHVGFLTWQKYLAAKRERIGKTYCSYVIKLANAEGLAGHLDDITGAQLIEYSKVLRPEEIVPAIKATKAKVRGLSARATNELLQRYRVKTLGKPARKDRTIKGVEDVLVGMLGKCKTEEERASLKKAVEKFLKDRNT